MIPPPLFEKAYFLPDDLPPSARAHCGKCGADVETVALVGVIESPTETVYIPELADVIDPPIARMKHGPDQACFLVGPCGHSSLDVEPDAVVFVIENDWR